MPTSVKIDELSRSEWLSLRTNGIGGSDVSAIMHRNRFKTALDVYLEKIGKKVSDSTNAKMEAGLRFENAVAEWFSDETGLRIRKFHHTFFDDDQPYIMANPDRQIIATENDPPLLTEEETGILEVKRTSSHYIDTWKYEVALPWYLQLQHYLTIKGYSYGYIVWQVRETDEVHWKRFEANDKVQNEIREACFTFWKEHVEQRKPPADTQEKQELIDLISKPIKGKTTHIGDDMMRVYRDFVDARRQRKRWEDKENKLKASLELYTGSAEKLLSNNGVVATYKEQSRDTINKGKLKSEYPDIYEECETSYSYRVFRPKFKPKNGQQP